MTRWIAISLLVLSIALLSTACGADGADGAEDEKLSDEFIAFIEESEPDSADDGQADDETSSDDVSNLIVETQSDDPPEDDNTFEETKEDIAWQSSWTSVNACENATKGVAMGVVPKAVQVAVNASGDAEVEVALCEPVNPEIPFTHLYSGYFHCLNWLDFGTEYHAGNGATLGMVEAAYGMPHGTLYYILRLPSDPWPMEIICEYGSVNESGDAFHSGSVNMPWQGPGPPGPSAPLPDDHSVPADATTLLP